MEKAKERDTSLSMSDKSVSACLWVTTKDPLLIVRIKLNLGA